MSNRTLSNGVHIDPRRPWSRERKFGWDAIYGPGASGVPVGSGGSGPQTNTDWPIGCQKPWSREAPDTDARTVCAPYRPTVLPSVLGQEAINIVFALCLAAGTLVSAAIANEPVLEKSVKVYSERME